MVKEIECPHCHTKIMPKQRFSSTTFAILLVLGVIPFIFNVVAYAILYNALSSFLELLKMILIQLATPSDGTPIPLEITESLTVTPFSLWVYSIATLVLILIIGIIPAVVYWAFRHGAYYCPMCEMTI